MSTWIQLLIAVSLTMVTSLKENVGARKVTLTKAELDSIDEIVGRIKVIGERCVRLVTEWTCTQY